MCCQLESVKCIYRMQSRVKEGAAFNCIVNKASSVMIENKCIHPYSDWYSIFVIISGAMQHIKASFIIQTSSHMKPRLDLVLFSVQPSCYCPTQMINPTGIINQYNERLLVSGLFWFVPCYRAGVYFVTLSSPGKDLNLCIYYGHGGAKINRERDC